MEKTNSNGHKYVAKNGPELQGEVGQSFSAESTRQRGDLIKKYKIKGLILERGRSHLQPASTVTMLMVAVCISIVEGALKEDGNTNISQHAKGEFI